jgi:SNF2 family DNA or RNA helicase
MNPTLLIPPVNTENNFLFISPEFGPAIQNRNKLERLPDCAFGAWYARTHYKHMQASAEGRDWFQKHNPLSLPTIPHLLNKPHIYQNLAIKRMLLGNCALWLDMGLGKSFIVLAYALLQTKKVFLIVCPLSVFVTWEDEVSKHISPEARAKVVFAHGDKKLKELARIKSSQTDSPTFIVTSYETLEAIRESIQDIDLGGIFFDEASKIKNWEAARTKSAHALVQRLYWVPRFLLSGTPSTTSITGYFSLYELLNRGASGFSNLYAFKHHYVDQKRFMIVEHPDTEGNKRLVHIFADSSLAWLRRNYPPNSMQTYAELGYTFQEYVRPDHNDIKIVRVYNKDCGAKNIDRLIKVTKTWAYTLKKEDVIDQLPEKTFTRRYIEMSEQQEKAYREVMISARTVINNVPFSFRRLNSPYAKLHQIANGYLINNDKTVQFFSSQPKLNELKLIIEEAGEQQIVIWSPFVHQIKQIGKFLTEEDITHSTIYGATSRDNRANNVREFQNTNAQICLANPAVAGLGLNFTNAHIEVFMTNWFQADIRAQAIDRCHRQGQKHAVSVIDLVTARTLELKILDSLHKNIDLENAILTMKDLGDSA